MRLAQYLNHLNLDLDLDLALIIILNLRDYWPDQADGFIDAMLAGAFRYPLLAAPPDLCLLDHEDT